MTTILENGICTADDLRKAAREMRYAVATNDYRHGYTSHAAALEAAEEFERDADELEAPELP